MYSNTFSDLGQSNSIADYDNLIEPTFMPDSFDYFKTILKWFW